MKVSPLKLHNYFEELYIHDSDDSSDTDILVDTRCTTSIQGASSIKKRGAFQNEKACLIPRSINYFIVTIIVHQFIERLKRRIVPKKYFLRTIKPKSEIMVNVGLRTLDTHRMIDVKALLDSGATGMFMDRKFAEGNSITLKLLE